MRRGQGDRVERRRKRQRPLGRPFFLLRQRAVVDRLHVDDRGGVRLRRQQRRQVDELVIRGGGAGDGQKDGEDADVGAWRFPSRMSIVLERRIVAASRHGFEVFDLGDALPQFVLQAHDDGHDGARAAGAGIAEPDLDHAAVDADDLDRRAVQVQGGADLLGDDLGDAVFQFVGGHRD